MRAATLLRPLRWFVNAVMLLAIALLLAAGVLWWWSGQEGSLEWALERIARVQPLEREGVRGSLRSGWRIDRLAWEHEGLRVEARDIALEWQPLALLARTLRLDQVRVGSVRVVDEREQDDEPFTLPQQIGLPWRVTVDEVRVDRFAYQGATRLEGTGLAGRYAFTGLRHELRLDALQFAGGRYRGEATLLASEPMTLDAQLAGQLRAAVPGSDTQATLVFEAQAEGPLRDFAVQARLRVPEGASAAGELPRATLQARITPLETMPVPQASARFSALDLAQFWPEAPTTALSGTLEVEPQGAGEWRLQADVKNAAPGAWDAGRLPLARASAEGEWRGDTALVRAFVAEVGRGRIEGEGRWEQDGWRFAGRVEALDPAQLHGAMASLPLSGPLTAAAGEGGAVEFQVDLQAAGPVRASRRAARGGDALQAALGALQLRELAATGRWADGSLALPTLRVRTSDAQLQGAIEVQPAQRAASGRLTLQAPGLQLRADGTLAATRGRGEATLQVPDVAQARQWLARWPGLDAVLAGPVARGAVEGSVAWQGGWTDPALQALLRTGRLEIGAAGAAPDWVLRDAQARVQGRLRDAAVDLRGQAEQGQRRIALEASGRAGQLPAGRGAGGWQGRLASLQLTAQDPALGPGAWTLRLRAPVGWQLAGERLTVDAGEALLLGPQLRSGTPASQAVLAWGPVERRGGELITSGQLTGLPLAWIERLGGTQLAGTAVTGDMVFDAQWQARLGDTVQVQATLVRTSGDLTVLAETPEGTTARVPAGVREARLTLSSQGEQLTLALRWDSERAGQAQGALRTRLARNGGGWSWPEQAPIEGRLQAQLPRLGVWSLLAPPGWRLRGSVTADLAFAGTRSDPVLTGTLSADDLALRSVVDGIELRNGRLRAELQGQRLVLREFLLHGAEEGGSGGGTLAAVGEGEWTPQGLRMRVESRLTRLRASLRSDRQLTVSGTLTGTVGPDGTRIEGALEVDRARIRIPDATAPRLGEDVVVRNVPGVAATEGERRQRPAPAAGGPPVTLAVTVDLGDDFRVEGRGLQTRLAGSLRMEGTSLQQPRLVGVVNAVGGRYEGYGQRMEIERGEIRFTGPVDNPALDVLAVRPNTEQRVGVLITGRAQSPRIELWSEAGLSEAETLSWLVLGRSSAGGGAEAALLQRAAAALLAGRSGTGRGIAGTLGLDDLSVRSDQGSGAMVRLGKRFADNFYAAYERSLSGALGTLYIFYEVSERFTIRAEAGERTGIDLIFTFVFDRPTATGQPAQR